LTLIKGTTLILGLNFNPTNQHGENKATGTKDGVGNGEVGDG